MIIVQYKFNTIPVPLGISFNVQTFREVVFLNVQIGESQEGDITMVAGVVFFRFFEEKQAIKGGCRLSQK